MASRGYDEDEEEDVNFDTLESTLLGEAFYGNSKAAAVHGMDLDKKINLSVRVQNDLVRSEKKGEKRINIKGREDRATSEQVLDPRTRLILLKLLNLGFLTQIDGCLSTGKEANVYYAKGENDKEYAVKIFKTSILVFKDRDKYVSGEYRFRHGYCRSNPRKMVKVWAEKEMRNLKRLQQAGLFAPVPHLLKSHVLIMDFIGEKGWCAPRLKDAQLNFEDLHEAYRVCVVMLRILLHDCGLIHGDFSEYNLLYHQGRIVVIDVSQSVELSHPLSLEFLRKDITNTNDFFARKGVVVLNKMDVFAYVTADPTKLSDLNAQQNVDNESPAEREQRLREVRWQQWREDFDSRLLAQEVTQKEKSGAQATSVSMRSKLSGQEAEDYDHAAKQAEVEEENRREVEEAVFMRSFIPTRLDEISQPMQEMKRLQQGQRENIFTNAISTMLAQTSIGYGSAAMAAVQRSNGIKSSSGIKSSAVDEGEGSEEENEDDDMNAPSLVQMAMEYENDDDEDGEDEDGHDSDEEDFQRLVRLLKGDKSNAAADGGRTQTTASTTVKSVSKPIGFAPRPAPATSAESLAPLNDSKVDKKSKKKAQEVAVDGAADSGNEKDDSDSDSSDDDDDSDDDSGSSDGENEKYRRQLPSHDTPELRALAKQQRKEAKKAAKEAKQAKRKTKIPKHVKRRATQNKHKK